MKTSSPLLACTSQRHNSLGQSRNRVALPKFIVLSFGLGVAGLSPIGSQSALAANKAYSTTPATGNFSGTNWTVGTTAATPPTDPAVSGDALFFGTSSITALTNDLPGASFAGFTFNTGAAAFTIGGNDFTPTGALTNNSTAAQIFNTNIAFGSQQPIVTNTGSFTLNGILSGTGFGITKTGTGLLTLSGANTFSGASTITGVLNASNNNALGTGGVTINAATGNQLQLANGVNLSNALTIAGGGIAVQGALYVPTGNATYSGTINITGATNAGSYFATGGQTSVLTIAGNNTISSTQPVTVRNGVVKYSGSQSYTTGTALGNSGAAIQFGQITSMPASGTVSLVSGTSAFFNVGGTGEFTNATTGNGSIGALLTGVGGQGAPLTLAAGSSIGLDTTNAGGAVTYAGAFTTANNVGLIKLGTGTLSLTNGGTFSGAGIAGFQLVTRQGTLQLNGGTFTSNGEIVVGGTFGTAAGAAGFDAKLQIDSGALNTNASSFLSVGRGNGIGGVSSDLVVNNAATVGAANFSAGFNGGSGSNLPKGTVTLNNTSALTINSGGAFNLAESTGSNFTFTANDSSTVSSLGVGGKLIGNGGTGVLTLNNSSTASFGTGPTTGTTGLGVIIGSTGGNGTLNVNGTANANFAGLVSAGFNTGTGAINVNGGTLAITGELRVGAYDTGNTATPTATGTYTQSGGTATVGSLALARANGGLNNINGTATVNGGTLTSTNDVVLGYAGTGTGRLVLGGGTVNVGTTATKALIVGSYDTAKGLLDLNSGLLKLNSNSLIRFLGLSGPNTTTPQIINQNGVNVTFYSDNGVTVGGTGALDMRFAGAATATGTTTYNLNSGTLTVPQVVSTTTVGGARTFNFNGGTLQAASSAGAATFFGANVATTANVRNGGAIINSNGLNPLIGQALVHSTVGGDAATDGGLTKNGLGTLTLTGANTYTGATTVSAGTLLINGDQTSATGAVNVTSSTLGGTGIVGGVTTIGSTATNAPGVAGPGSETFKGDYTNNGVLSVDIAGATAGTGYDQVNVVGAVNFAGTLRVTMPAGFTPNLNDKFVLIQNDGTDAITPSSSGLAEGSLINSTDGRATFQVSYNGGDGNDLMLTSTSSRVTSALLSEFRLSGPGTGGTGNTADEFIEIGNNTNAPLDLTGWTLTAGATTIALSGSIPDRGHYLVVGTGYSLGGVALGDQTVATDIPLNAVLTLTNAAGTVVDVVNTGGALVPTNPNNQYSFVRKFDSGVAQDTDTDNADFNLVDISRAVSTSDATGVAATVDLGGRLGAPGPQSVVSASPTQRNNRITYLPLAGPAANATVKYPGTTTYPVGQLSLRRTITNNSGKTVTKMRFRLAAVTAGASNTTTAADLRAISSTGVVVNGVAVQALQLDAPSVEGGTNNGGGLNSTWSVTLPGSGLTSGSSVNVEFLFGVVKGGAYKAVIDTELAP